MSEYDLNGLPKDLLSSKIEGERALKVAIKETEELSLFVAKGLAKISDQLSVIIKQQCLLNVRFEEIAQTKINLDDIGD